MELDHRTVLLTGATGGLGRAIAAALARRGATLVLSSRKAAELDELASSLPGEGHRLIVCDLDEPGAVERLAGEAGALDVLIANAGLGGNGRFESFEAERIERLVRVNLEVPMLLARALVPAMRERGEGQLVFISSLAGKAVSGRSALYSATKAGLRAFALGLRQDLGAEGIGVSVVNPGFVREAGMFHESGRTPPPGLGTTTPERVGEAVAEAIEQDRAELDVAPLQQRVLANFAGRRPHLAARITRGRL